MAKATESNSAETKMGDIKTAAKSTMAPHSYERGYPRQPGALENENFADHKRTSRKG